MVTKIKAVGFKGWSGEQAIGEKTLLVGDNGKGKSDRSQALQLAVNGYVIGSGKKNEEILSTFGEGDKLVVGAEIDGTLFERGFVRASSGSVSQGYKVSGSKVSKDFFNKAMGEAGAPVILNVAEFIALSDQKKIESLFTLYPPAGNLDAVQDQIETAKEKINALNQKVKSTEQAAARIAASKAEIKIPAGTLAEIDAEIAQKESELTEARNNLTNLKIEEQRIESEAKAKEEAERKEQERLKAEEKARKAGEEAKAKAEISPDPIDAKVQQSLKENPGEMTKKVDAMFGTEKALGDREFFASASPLGQTAQALVKREAAASILSIVSALTEAGCGTCAAGMIARRELRKYQEVAHG